jgi:hypothetical protein
VHGLVYNLWISRWTLLDKSLTWHYVMRSLCTTILPKRVRDDGVSGAATPGKFTGSVDGESPPEPGTLRHVADEWGYGVGTGNPPWTDGPGPEPTSDRWADEPERWKQPGSPTLPRPTDGHPAWSAGGTGAHAAVESDVDTAADTGGWARHASTDWGQLRPTDPTAPRSAPPYASPPIASPPYASPPFSGAPYSGPPSPAQSYPVPPASGPPYSSPPYSGASYSGVPASGAPHTSPPYSGAPYSSRPYSGAPYSGPPSYGPPPSGASPSDAPYASPPYSGAPYSGAPRSGAPNSGVPHSGAPYAGAPYSEAPRSGAPYSGQPYTDQPYPEPYADQSYPAQPYGVQSYAAPPVPTRIEPASTGWNNQSWNDPAHAGPPHASPGHTSFEHTSFGRANSDHARADHAGSSPAGVAHLVAAREPQHRGAAESWSGAEPAARHRTFGRGPQPVRESGPAGGSGPATDEEPEPPTYARVLAFTAAWYGGPLLVFLLWLLILAGDRRGEVAHQFTASLPWLLVAASLSLVFALVLRRTTVGWRTVGLSFAAAIIGAGAATLGHSLFG